MTGMRKTILVAAAGLMLAGWAGPVLAQYALGDGSGLDNNLNPRSHGRNDRYTANTPGQYQNALITGNVQGLGNFRGDVGYRAAGEFRDNLGSNDLFNYYQRSTGAGAASASSVDRYRAGYAASGYDFGSGGGGGGASDSIYGADSRIVYRAGTGSSIGQATRQSSYSGNYTAGSAQTFDAQSVSREYGIGQLDRPVFGESSFYRPSNLASGQDAMGRNFTVTASPLTGISVRRPGSENLYQRSDYGYDAETSRELDGVAPLDVEADEPNDASRLDQRLSFGLSDQARMTARRDFTRRLHYRLGADGTVESLEDTARARTDGQAPGGSQLDESLDTLLGSATAKPGDDVYFDLLRRVRGQDYTKTQANRQVPVTPQDEQPDTQPKEHPTGVQVEEYVAEPNDAAEAEEPRSAMEQVMQRLDYDIEPMRSLSGTRKTLFNEMMADAEKYMREGRFFDAESAYDRALSLRKNYPLALVGKAHAQMGAGLYRSADRTLRSLFLRHPELISARYTQPLLPDAERLDAIKRQLASLVQSEPSHRGAPLLLAYLAYQQGRPEDLAAHLDTLAEREPSDSLVRLLRRLWMDAETDSESGDK